MNHVLENQRLKKMKFYLLWRKTGDIVKAYASSYDIKEEDAAKMLCEMKIQQEKLLGNITQSMETVGTRK